MALKVGDKVTCSAEYDFDKHVHLASFVRSGVFYVIQIGGKSSPDNRVVISTNKSSSGTVAAVDISTLSVVGDEPKPTPQTPPTPEPEPKDTANVNDIAEKLINSANRSATSTLTSSPISGAVVQTMKGRYNASGINSSPNGSVSSNGRNTSQSSYNSTRANLIARQDPSLWQNSSGFPPVARFNSQKGYYEYNYFQNYDADGLNLDGLRKSINEDMTDVNLIKKRYTEYYNKFKIPNRNEILTKSFAHVFFVRPDCNIYAEGSSGSSPDPTLAEGLASSAEFFYAKKHCPDLLRQLTQDGASYDHEFMLYLSNKAESFSLKDEFIETDEYGKGWTGYAVSYGRNNVASKKGETFDIEYHDTRDLGIYHLHKLWSDYISMVYRGKVTPVKSYIENKILDYATCVYYFLCAEDGETVIFWSKYWGVFPTEAPSSQYSYTAANLVSNPSLKISYKYSWKEDFNPLTMVEFNTHTSGNYIYNTASDSLRGAYTWSGTPFVETFNTPGITPYTFKLRFRQGPN